MKVRVAEEVLRRQEVEERRWEEEHAAEDVARLLVVRVDERRQRDEEVLLWSEGERTRLAAEAEERRRREQERRRLQDIAERSAAAIPASPPSISIGVSAQTRPGVPLVGLVFAMVVAVTIAFQLSWRSLSLKRLREAIAAVSSELWLPLAISGPFETIFPLLGRQRDAVQDR